MRVASALGRLALAGALPLAAHMVSMSTGDLRIEGTRAIYELRMPLYEVAHAKDPEQSLFEHIRFGEARLRSKQCASDAQDGAYHCTAEYEFPAPPSRLDVECTLHSVTVPNHVHMLRVSMGDKNDQAVFDLSFTRAEMNFRPLSAAEIALREGLAGMMRAAGGAAQILFLAGLALAARTRRELIELALWFLTGEILAAAIVPATAWRPAPRFIEAAAALTVAYLAVEILLLPKAGRRWLVAGVLGLFHGLYFAAFLTTTEYHAVWVLLGAALVELILIAGFAWALARLARIAAALRPVQVGASLLLAAGMVWFVLRLRG